MTRLSRREPKRRFAAYIAPAIPPALLLGAMLLLPACGGSSAAKSDASVGKQLATLREAYDKGVITRDEYERERRRIIGDW